MSSLLPELVLFAGLGQLILVIASPTIPMVLRWREDLAKLRPLTRQMFWIYAGYIWTTNLTFGLISALAPSSLVDRSTLAAAVTAFMTAYWGARLTIQFTVLDRKSAPRGIHVHLAEAALVSLFIFLAAVYGLAAVFNVGGLE